MRPKSSTLTPHELELMKIVWRHDEGVTVRDVYEELRAERAVAYTTVMTSLKTLEQKGHLKATQLDRAHLYHPARPKHQVIREMVREFVNRVFNGSGQPLVVHMLEDDQISESELREITRMLGEEAMTARLLLANIAAFSLQATVLVAAGAALARAFRIDEPKAMLGYWRTLLAVCLVLPLCQPWTTLIPPALQITSIAAPVSAAPVVVTETAPRALAWPLVDIALFVLSAGIAARALWLTIGAYTLGRLWRSASPLDPIPASVRGAQERIGAQAGLYVSDRISGPITFGVLRPVIVFPPSVSGMPAHVQEAIACHELLHVRRRDWLYEILEEAVRTVLWFHPAIWWLIGRVQLTREQVVDQAAIAVTDSRERYVEALLAVARANTTSSVTPVSAFLRRHALKKRVARILQETTMTTRRLIASLTASAAALALAATFAVRLFPLQAQGQAQADTGVPIQIAKGSEHLLHGALPDYPKRAIEHKVEGDVVIDLTVDERGEVSDARVLSGPDELRRAALEAVLQWHYSPAALSSTITQTTLRFRVPPGGFEKAEHAGVIIMSEHKDGWAWSSNKIKPEAEHELKMVEMRKAIESAHAPNERAELHAKYAEMKEAYDVELKEVRPEDTHLEGVAGGVPGGVEGGVQGGVARELVGKMYLKMAEAHAREAKLDGPVRLTDIRTERVSTEMAKQLVAQAGVAVGDLLTEDALKRIQKAVTSADEHLRVEFEKGKGGLVVVILTR